MGAGVKRTTSVAQAVDGDRPRPTRREIELMLLACAAEGQHFDLRPNARGGAAVLTLGRDACDVARLDLLT